MKMPSKLTCAFFATIVLAACSANADSIITFSVDMSQQIALGNFNPATDSVLAQGTYNNWSPFIQLNRVGTTSIYTNNFDDTLEANGISTHYQYLVSTNLPGTTNFANYFETSADFNLRAAILSATSGGAVVLPTVFFNDNDGGATITNSVTFQVDMSQQIALGHFSPSANTVEVQGNFTGWATSPVTLALNPAIVRTNSSGLASTNVYVGTLSIAGVTNAAMDYKFVIEPGAGYESPSSLGADNGGNRFFVNNTNQVLPVVDFSDAPYAPIANITFNIDMAAVYISDPGFDPASVTLNGDFNNWTTGIAATNATGGDTNIFSATISAGAGSLINYQFRYSSSGGTQYDNPTGGGNRTFRVPNISNTNLPAVFFNDINVSDLLTEDTTVMFSVNLTNAVDTTSHTFDPNNDTVYINGDFLGWVAWDSPIALAGDNMTNNPPGSEVYSYTYVFPKGHSRSVTYKYSVNTHDDEAGFGLNHVRFIRSTNGTENFALDKFGSPTVEPKFGNLKIGAKTGAAFPVTWLGYPNVHLQSRTNLAVGAWQDVPATQGLNGTNVPSGSGSGYFRLIQQ